MVTCLLELVSAHVYQDGIAWFNVNPCPGQRTIEITPVNGVFGVYV
jgi:hypothetical protein